MADEKRQHRGRPGRGPKQARPDAEAPVEAPQGGMRLNRYIARAGVCSRRKADELIRQQRVKVNGEVVADFGRRVEAGDVVEVGGRVISPRATLYLLVNKPRDVITTTRDERGRQTVMDLLDLPEAQREGLFPVGRLDRDTVGTLLMTNDGELAHRLMHPRYRIEKRYVVRTREAVKPHQIDQLKRGVELEDGLARADEAIYVRPPNHHEIGLQLHEGRNRQVRRMLEALGHEVVSLERVQYAGLSTEGVRRGKWRKLFPHEIRRLRNLVHLK